MPLPENADHNLIQQWLFKATEDLKAADILLQSGEEFTFAVGFHCQQAAEKVIKAYLTSKHVDFPKTHDLEILLELIATVDSELALKLDEVSLLTPYGVQTRYPTDLPQISDSQAKQAFALADFAYQTIIQILL